MYTPRYLRIWSYTSKTIIVHFEDMLDLGKVRIDAYNYEQGKGAKANIAVYLDADDARLIARLIATDRLTKWGPDYKGSPNRATGEIISRVLTIEKAEGPDIRVPGIRFTLAQGPGKTSSTGAVMPAGELQKLTVLLPATEALKMALTLIEHLQAWATVSYRERKAACWTPETQPQEHQEDEPEAQPTPIGDQAETKRDYHDDVNDLFGFGGGK